ncbi:MAG: hypothetical protein HZB91_11155 [Elusimicrobia bacterium]|nr:hypothetical protein [Elusimicrobiota bacterium]
MVVFEAFLFLAVGACAEAKGPVLCIRKTSQGYEEPASLTALLRCQEGETDGFLEDYRTAHDGNDPPDEALSSLATRQMRQAGEYVKRRPKDADSKGVAELGKRLEGQVEARMNDKDKEELRQIQDLQKSLGRKADAKRGLTPEMADEAREHVRKKQGGVSADLDMSLDAIGRYSREPGAEAMEQLKPGYRPPENNATDPARDDSLKALEERIRQSSQPEPEPARSE